MRKSTPIFWAFRGSLDHTKRRWGVKKYFVPYYTPGGLDYSPAPAKIFWAFLVKLLETKYKYQWQSKYTLLVSPAGTADADGGGFILPY